jgi:hypothetical protein
VIRVGQVREITRIWVWCLQDEAGTRRSRLDDEASEDPIGWRLSSRSEGDHRLTCSVAWSLKMREDNLEDRESSERHQARLSRKTGPSQISCIGFSRISNVRVDRLRRNG